MIRALLAAGLLLTAAVALAAPASADQYTVGKCEMSGACVGVCVADADTSCYNDAAVCIGASHQVPQCIAKQD